MTDNFSACSLSVIVGNKPTLCSPLTLSAFKNGISVPLSKTLHPNNGLRSYTQFDETVRLVMHYDIPFDKTIQNVVTLLQAHTTACFDTEKEKKLVFWTRQLELLLQKQFSTNDYCFALQSYPKCNYEQLRDFLVLPCKRKLQYITSSIDKDRVLWETSNKVQTLQQKNVFLLVDEVQIHRTVSFPGGLLSGMANHNRDCKATSILITSKPQTSRPRKIKDRAARKLARTVVQRPQTFCEELKDDLKVSGIEASKRTISRALRREGLRSCIPHRTPFLQKRHVKSRLKYTNDHLNNPVAFWNSVRGVPGLRKAELPLSVVQSSKAVLRELTERQQRALIKKYPGTGKSICVVTLVRLLVVMGQSVLLAAYTHSALDNIPFKLKEKGVDFLPLGRLSCVHPSLHGHIDETLTATLTDVSQLSDFYASKVSCVVVVCVSRGGGGVYLAWWCVSRVEVVTATCLGPNHVIFTKRRFDVCIVDEAAQVLLPTCLPPLLCADKFVLVGDSQQLLPVVQSSQARCALICRFLARRLPSKGPEHEQDCVQCAGAGRHRPPVYLSDPPVPHERCHNASCKRPHVRWVTCVCPPPSPTPPFSCRDTSQRSGDAPCVVTCWENYNNNPSLVMGCKSVVQSPSDDDDKDFGVSMNEILAKLEKNGVSSEDAMNYGRDYTDTETDRVKNA
ncbi:Transposase Tc1-like [Trinorchestia longiramus]|nr:Transposase Tc1-like [Trinorchestia longiramus]